jgi:cobalt-zinc-cadmium efflux system outer membrane protein
MFPIRLQLMTSLAAVTVFACSGCIRYTAEPIDPARRATLLTNRKLASRTWTLAMLTKEALRRNANIAFARSQYGAARAAIATAGERPNPTIALSPQIVTPYTAWIPGTYGVDFDWTIETAGKRSRRTAIAVHQANAAAAHVIEAEWKVRAAVRKALLELSAAERRATLLAEASAKQVDVVRLIDDRIKAGAASLLESAQPRLLAAQLRIQVSDAGRAKALARAALAESLTMGTSGLDGAQFSFAAFDGIPGKRAPRRREALTHRADILAALAEYAAAEATLRLEVAKQYPDVHLNPGYQLDAGENKWALGVGLTLPILNQNRGLIREAEAKRKEAAARFDVVQATVLADCDRAVASVSAARAKLATTDQLLMEQRHQIESLQRIVAAGEGDKIALLSAEVERATTNLSRLDALTELHAALGALEEATQTPLEK